MPKFIRLPSGTRIPMHFDPTEVCAVEPSERHGMGGCTVHLSSGFSFFTGITVEDVVDLINAAMHPTTETETR
jgi:hypothetical protein